MNGVQAFTLLFLAFLLSWLTNLAFKGVISRLVKKTHTDADDRIIAAIKNPITISIISGTIVLILNPYAPVIPFITYFNYFIITFLITIWSLALIKVLDALLDEIDHHFSRRLTHHDLFPFFKSLIRIVVLGSGLLAIFLIWKIDVTPFLAAGGLAGVALAFAAKDTVANIFGGISIFLDQPYKIGDYIVVGDNERGEVITIGARTTKIKTRDDVLISIPNSVMSTSKIVNETGIHPPLRIRVQVGLPYTCNLAAAEDILLKSITKTEGVLTKPEPRVRYREFGNSSINAEVMGWVHTPADKGLITHQVIKHIKKDLDQAGISIPFPQRDVHLYKK